MTPEFDSAFFSLGFSGEAKKRKMPAGARPGFSMDKQGQLTSLFSKSST